MKQLQKFDSQEVETSTWPFGVPHDIEPIGKEKGVYYVAGMSGPNYQGEIGNLSATQWGREEHVWNSGDTLHDPSTATFSGKRSMHITASQYR